MVLFKSENSIITSNYWLEIRQKPEKSPRCEILPRFSFLLANLSLIYFNTDVINSTCPKLGACCCIKEKREQWECPQGGPRGLCVSLSYTHTNTPWRPEGAAGDLTHQHPPKILILHLPAKRTLINHSHTCANRRADYCVLTSWPRWLERLSIMKNCLVFYQLLKWRFMLIWCSHVFYTWKLNKGICPWMSSWVPLVLDRNIKGWKNLRRIVLDFLQDSKEQRPFELYNTLKKNKKKTGFLGWTKIVCSRRILNLSLGLRVKVDRQIVDE